MSRRGITWLLWVAAAVLLPLPFFLAQTGVVPPLRMLMLAAIGLAIVAVEGGQGVVGLGAALLLGQAAVYLLALWLTAALIARALVRLVGRMAVALALAVVVAATAAAVGFDLYRDPFRAATLRTDLLHVYE